MCSEAFILGLQYIIAYCFLFDSFRCFLSLFCNSVQFEKTGFTVSVCPDLEEPASVRIPEGPSMAEWLA